MAGIIGEAWLALRPDTTGFSGETESKLKSIFKGGQTGILGNLNAIGAGAVGAFVAASAASVKLAETFQSTEATLQGTAGISAKAATSIGDAFLSTAGKTTFSAQQIISAYTPVAGQLGQLNGKALSAAQALGVMTAATDLAEASGQPLADVTTTLAHTLNDLHQPISQAATDANVLFNTARLTGSGVTDIGSAIDRLAPKIVGSGVTINQLGGIIDDMSTKLGSGRRAIMTAGTALQTLLAPSSAATKELTKVGVSLTDSQGKFIGFGPALDALKAQLSTVSSPLARNAELATLFGKNSQVMGQLIQGGSGALAAFTARVSQNNAVQAAAKAQAQTLHGELKTMGATIQDLATKWGLVLIPIIQKAGIEVAKLGAFFVAHKAIALALAGVIGGVLVASVVVFIANMAIAAVTAVANFAVMIAQGAVWVATQSAQFATWVAEQAASVGETTAIWALYAADWIASSAASTATFIAEQAVALGSWVAGVVASAATAAAGFAVGMAGMAISAISAAASIVIAWLPVIAPIAAVVAIGYVVYRNWGTISHALIAVWHAIEDAAKAVFGAVVAVLGSVVDWVKDHWQLLLAILTGPVGLATLFIKDHLADIVSFFTSLGTDILNALSGAATWLLNVGHDIIKGAITGITLELKGVQFLFGTLPKLILGYIGDAAKWLLNVGEDIIKGLIKGIENGVKAIPNALGDVAKSVKKAITDPLGIFSPSTVFATIGGNLMEGLANGIANKATLPQSALKGVTLNVPGIGAIGPSLVGGGTALPAAIAAATGGGGSLGSPASAAQTLQLLTDIRNGVMAPPPAVTRYSQEQVALLTQIRELLTIDNALASTAASRSQQYARGR